MNDLYNWDVLFAKWHVSKKALGILNAEYTFRKDDKYFTISFFMIHTITGNCLSIYGLENLPLEAGHSLFRYAMDKYSRIKSDEEINALRKLQKLGVLPNESYQGLGS